LRGDQGLGPNTGALVPGVEYRRGSPAVRVWGITPGKFLKTQMLNPAFW